MAKCKYCKVLERREDGSFDTTAAYLYDKKVGKISGSDIYARVNLYADELDFTITTNENEFFSISENDRKGITIKYCPMCGRKLEKRKDLIKLIEKQEEPEWFKEWSNDEAD